MDTSQILFVCGGAFEGIEDIIRRRLQTKALGFKHATAAAAWQNQDPMPHLSVWDLRAYGFIPELVGRLPVQVHVGALDEDTLFRILTEPKNALIKQYQKLFALDGCVLRFQDASLRYLVQLACTQGLGARSLRNLCEAAILDIMFDMPSNKHKKTWVITKAAVQRTIDNPKFKRFAA